MFPFPSFYAWIGGRLLRVLKIVAAIITSQIVLFLTAKVLLVFCRYKETLHWNIMWGHQWGQGGRMFFHQPDSMENEVYCEIVLLSLEVKE